MPFAGQPENGDRTGPPGPARRPLDIAESKRKDLQKGEGRVKRTRINRAPRRIFLSEELWQIRTTVTLVLCLGLGSSMMTACTLSPVVVAGTTAAAALARELGRSKLSVCLPATDGPEISAHVHSTSDERFEVWCASPSDVH